MHVYMMHSLCHLQMKFSRMLANRKPIHLQMDSWDTTKLRLHQRIEVRLPSLQNSQYTVMPFQLKNAPAIFSRVVVVAFKEFIYKFLGVCFNDWIVFGLVKKHVSRLRLMLDTCRKYQISLNWNKCIFLCTLWNIVKSCCM